MSEDQAATQEAAPPGPAGLGGWLILPAIGMFINLYIFGKTCLGLAALTMPGLAEKLAAAGIDIHDAAWVRLVTFEAIGYPMLFLLDIVLIVLFFTKSYWFPRVMIGFLVAILVISSLDVFFVSWVALPDSADTGGNAVKLMRPVVVCMIWIPYFLTSVRVKNTFTRHRPVPATLSP